MVDDMVMRSVYLRPAEDAQLRQLAHELNVTKSDLIRSAISVKLLEWLRSNDRTEILKDVEHGRRDEAAIRSGRRGRRRAVPAPLSTGKDAVRTSDATSGSQMTDQYRAEEALEG